MGWPARIADRWRMAWARGVLSLDADAQAMMADMTPEEREELVRSHVEHVTRPRRDRGGRMDDLRDRD